MFANAGHLVESAQLKDMKAAIAKRKPSAGSEFSEGHGIPLAFSLSIDAHFHRQ